MAGLGMAFSGAAGGVYDARNEGFDQDLRARALALQEDRVRQEMKLQEEDRQLRIQEAVRAAAKEKYARLLEQGNYGFDEPGGGQAPTPVAGVRSIAEPEGPRAGAPPGGLPGPRPITAVSAIEQFTGEPLSPEGPRAGAPAGGLPQNTQPAAQAAPGGTIDAGLVSQYRPAAPGPGGQPGRFQVPASMTMPGLKLGDQELVPSEEVPIPTRAQRRARMYQDAVDKFFSTPQTAKEGEETWLGGEMMMSGGRKKAPGFEGEYIARLEEKLGRPLAFEEFQQALQQYRRDNSDPNVQASRNITDAINELRLQGLKENEISTVPQGSNEYRLAEMLADGRMTIGQFRTAMGRGSNNKLRTAILVEASNINPNFNPAAFEMGFSFARSPQTQRSIAAVDNVMPNVEKITQLSKQWDRTKFPDINKWLGTLQLKIGNTTVGNIRQAQQLVGDELALALGGGAMTDMKLKLGLDVVNPDLPHEVFAANMERVKEFLNNRKLSLLGQMGPYGLPGMNPGAGAAIPSAVAAELAKKPDGDYDFEVDGQKVTYSVRGGNIYNYVR